MTPLHRVAPSRTQADVWGVPSHHRRGGADLGCHRGKGGSTAAPVRSEDEQRRQHYIDAVACQGAPERRPCVPQTPVHSLQPIRHLSRIAHMQRGCTVWSLHMLQGCNALPHVPRCKRLG